MIFLNFLCFSIALGAEQNENHILNKHITIYGGARFYQADGTFSSTRKGNPLIEVGMDDLGLDKHEVNAIGGIMFNLGEKWNLRFDYFGYHDSAEKIAGKTFNFDRITIPVNASVSTSLDIDLYVCNLAYNIIHTQKSRFGLGLGVHGIDFDIQLSGKISVAGKDVAIGDGQEDFLAPVPNIWIYGAYALTKNTIFKYGVGWMSASYGNYDGDLILANAAVEYWPFQNIGFGFGYNYINADIDYETDYKKENYEVDLPGIVLYLTMGF